MNGAITRLSGEDPAKIWEEVARLYRQFAIDEGEKCDRVAQDFHKAVQAKSPGYNLALIGRMGLIAWTDFPSGPEILDLFVHRAYRGQGLAQRMVQWLAEKRSQQPLNVAVSRNNIIAQSLYSRLGFRQQPAHLFFCDREPINTDQHQFATMFDAQLGAWMPATWPDILRNEAQLEAALDKGARRFWVQQNTAVFETALTRFPHHPQAQRMEKHGL